MGRLSFLKSTAPAVLTAFFASRLLIFVVVLLISRLETAKITFGGQVRETRINLGRDVGSVWDPFMVADAGWFRSIAEDGYAREAFHEREQRNWAFLPAFPLLVRYLRILPSYAPNAILLSNLLFLAALFALHGAARASGLGETAARRAVALAAFFPTSYFFFVPGSESLYLLAAAVAWWAAARDQWGTAGAVACVAAATRVTGILLLPALLVLFLQSHRRLDRRAAWLLLIPAGLAGFMLFLWRTTGNPLAFVEIQSLWHRSTSSPLAPYLQFFRDLPVVSVEWNLRILHASAGLLMLGATVLLALRRRYALSFFLVATLTVALSSGSLQSLTRYAATAFPLFVAMGDAVEDEALAAPVLGASAALLGVLTCLFAMRVDIGMA